MTERDHDLVREVAELEVRRYFDHYLQNTFPVQVEKFIDIHDLCPDSHGGVERKFSRMVWVIVGASAAGGGVVAGAAKLFALAAGGG